MWCRWSQCNRCTLLSTWAVLLTVAVISYFPLMFVMSPAPPFAWGPTVDRNVSRYVRPDRNTTLLQPAGHARAACRPLLLIMVSSAVTNFAARAAIRQTWGSRTALPEGVQVLFLLGTDNGTLADNVAAEQRVHNDIVQQDFNDTYSNLTVKTVMMLKWATGECSPAYIMKTDEDMWVNTPRLVDELRRIGRPDLILGALICDAPPRRDRYSKYYSPAYMFAHHRFPAYVSGTGYVLAGAVAARLLDAALHTPLYHLEDVFVTGICAARLGVTPADHAGFSWIPLQIEPCTLLRAITAHEVPAQRLLDVWRRMEAPGVRLRCAAATTPRPRTLAKCRRPSPALYKRWPPDT